MKKLLRLVGIWGLIKIAEFGLVLHWWWLYNRCIELSSNLDTDNTFWKDVKKE